jgi:hypothetical protein
MDAMEFSKLFHKKQLTVEGFNRFIRQSCEFEVISAGTQYDALSRKMRTLGGTYASNEGLNDGNGFNDDWHADGGPGYYNSCGGIPATGQYGHAYGVEVSTSPLDGFNFRTIREELTKNVDLLERTMGTVYHGSNSSCHLHNTVAWFSDGYQTHQLLENLPVQTMYEHIAKVLVAFMPVMKWLAMTSPSGPRASCNTHDTEYDRMHNDYLYEWFASPSNYNLSGLGRASYMRVHGQGYGSSNIFYWENRMMDCNASPTMLAAWFSLNRAISLWAFDFAQNGFNFEVSQEDARTSKATMHTMANGWKGVRREYINDRWALLKSYLVKYFRKSDSMAALEYLDKLIEKPIPQWLEEVGRVDAYGNATNGPYRATEFDKAFNERNRAKDESLQQSYLLALKSMIIPMADNLDSFHDNVAAHLKIQKKQAVSQYQMAKRDEIPIDFMCGRILYMGD